jgi:hypothetical protein
MQLLLHDKSKSKCNEKKKKYVILQGTEAM